MNMQKLMNAGLSEQDINDYRSAFQMFDKNNTGVISGESLKAFYAQFGSNFSDEDVKTMVTEFTGDSKAQQINFMNFAMNFHTKKTSWLRSAPSTASAIMWSWMANGSGLNSTPSMMTR